MHKAILISCLLFIVVRGSWPDPPSSFDSQFTFHFFCLDFANNGDFEGLRTQEIYLTIRNLVSRLQLRINSYRPSVFEWYYN